MEHKHKILVVDDSKIWLKAIQLTLNNFYELVLLNNFRQIEEEIVKSDFSLIILDKNIPRTSGLEILKNIRERNIKTPAIILTRFPDVDSAVESMKLGAIDYISKATPNFSKIILQKIEEAINKSHESKLGIRELIAKGESKELEFKSSARWDLRENRLNKELERVIIKNIAAFMNSETGGDLIIGVDDSGKILGLLQDYKTLGKRQDRDGFENLLMNLLFEACGKECTPLINFKFHKIDENEICQINIKPSSKPNFVKDEKGENLYVRTGNSTRQLSTREALEYCKIRFVLF